MLLRLAYLGVSNAFASLRLLPMSDQDKDAEIPALAQPTQARGAAAHRALDPPAVPAAGA